MPRRTFWKANRAMLNNSRHRVLCSAFLILVGLLAGFADPGSATAQEPAGDWPQFHGPRRDNISPETGLLKEWPEGGPELLWKAKGIGHGWATVAIVGGRIYTAGDIEDRTVITALGLDGTVHWQQDNGPAYDGQFPGARGTPTIDGGRLYLRHSDWLYVYGVFGGEIDTPGGEELPTQEDVRIETIISRTMLSSLPLRGLCLEVALDGLVS